MAMDFLNKLYNKVIFSDAPNLNLGAYDMGVDQCTVTLTKKGVNRLETATGTVGSLEIFVPVEMSVSVKKTSPVMGYYKKAILENGYIGGSVTLYDDVNTSYTAIDPSVSCSELGALNGTEPAVKFTIDANLKVNSNALEILGLT